MSGFGLHVAVVGASGKGVACLTTIRAETSLESTASFLEGERPTRPTSTVEIYRCEGGCNMLGYSSVGVSVVFCV